MICEPTDYIFPMLADVYYPIVEQGAYGNVKKNWVLDRSIACNFNVVGTAGKEEIKPNVNITQDNVLLGRVKNDIRISHLDTENSITNVVISNIRDKHSNPIYKETSGARAGKSTIYEIASQEPIVGPFGNIEYYKIVIRRSENQAVDL
jgi:hypothetical protein